jgi:hypothetical protein
MKHDEMDGTGSADERDEKCTQNLSENVKGRVHLGYLGVHDRMDPKEVLWNCNLWLRIGSSGALL